MLLSVNDTVNGTLPRRGYAEKAATEGNVLPPMAMPDGELPTFIVAETVFAAVLITETVLSSLFATYTFFPSGVIATPLRVPPIDTAAVEVPVAALITSTMPGKVVVT